MLFILIIILLCTTIIIIVEKVIIIIIIVFKKKILLIIEEESARNNKVLVVAVAGKRRTHCPRRPLHFLYKRRLGSYSRSLFLRRTLWAKWTRKIIEMSLLPKKIPMIL